MCYVVVMIVKWKLLYSMYEFVVVGFGPVLQLIVSITFVSLFAYYLCAVDVVIVIVVIITGKLYLAFVKCKHVKYECLYMLQWNDDWCS